MHFTRHLIVIASDRMERSNLIDPVDCEIASSLMLLAMTVK